MSEFIGEMPGSTGEMPQYFIPRAIRRANPEMGISLVKRRTWYEDGEGDSGGDDLGKYRAEDLPGQQKITEALLKRLSERDAENGALKQQINDLSGRMTAAEKAQRQKLEEDGNYKALIDQMKAENEGLKPYKDRTSSLEELIREQNDLLIQQIPEDRRDIVPVDYAPEKLFKWLVEKGPKLAKQAPPNYDGGAGAAGGGNGSQQMKLTEEERQFAIAAGISPEKYAESKAKRGQPVELKPPG